jgi:hypothetical protein
MRHRLVRALAGVAVVAAAAAGASYATAHLISVSTTVIQACQNSGNGVLRVISDSSGCHANETPISWNVQGPKGDPGPQGPQGPAGTVASFQSLAGTSCRSRGVDGTLDVWEVSGLISSFQATCLVPDAAEPNNTRAAAAAMPERNFNNFQAGGTVYPAGDEDWWSASPQFPSHTVSIQATEALAYEIYVDGALAKSGTVDGSTEQLAPSPGTHSFLVHVAASSAGGTGAYGITIF